MNWNRSLLACVALAAGVHADCLRANASTVYNVDIVVTSATPTGNPSQTDSIVGTLTTDGTLGALGTTNLLAWNLQLIDGLNSSYNYTLTQTNSTVVADSGGALTASVAGLSFNYGLTNVAFLIQANNPGTFSGYHYFSLSNGYFATANGETISPNYYYTDAVVTTTAPTGIQPLNPTPTPSSATPEPATFALIGAGLGIAGLVRKVRSRS